MSDQEFPSRRHDGESWTSFDEHRAPLSGNRLGFVMFIMRIKGDWSEYGSTLGFPTWRDLLRPCFSCNVPPTLLYSVEGCGPLTWPHRENDEEDYFTAVRRCELMVTLESALQHRRVVSLLFNDRRQDGGHGRTLLQPILIGTVQLRAGDRLEPNPLLEDPSDFESISKFPTPVLFWRSRSGTLARHNNPIFNQGLGITPRRCLTVDGLHAVYLGIMLVFCRHVVWVVLTSNLWRGGVGTQEENIEAGLEVLRYTLTQWYKERARLHPEEELTRISKATRKMVVESGNRKL